MDASGVPEVLDAGPGLPAGVVLAGPRGEVHLHPLVFDRDGNGWLTHSAASRPHGSGRRAGWAEG